MLCPHCDHKNEEGIRFCTSCGELLSKKVRGRKAETPTTKTPAEIKTPRSKKGLLLGLAVFVICVLGITLVCKLKNQSSQNKIIGKWLCLDSYETWDFLKNRTIKIYSFDILTDKKYKYEINDKEHITIRMRDFPEKYKFLVDGDELTLALVSTGEPLPIKFVRIDKVKPEVIKEEKRKVCLNNLKQIGMALWMWATDHGGKFPEDLADLSPYVGNGDVFRCPGDRRYKETIKELKKDTPLSYDYVKGLTSDAKDRIIVYDSLKENHGDGRSVLFVFGYVKYLQEEEFQGTFK